MPAKRKKTAAKQKKKKVSGKKRQAGKNKAAKKKTVKKAITKNRKKSKAAARRKSTAKKAKLKTNKVKKKLKSKKALKKPAKASTIKKAKSQKSATKPKKPQSAKTSKKKTAPRLKVVRGKLDPALLKFKEKLISERNDLLRMIASSQEIERNVGDIAFSNEIDLASSLEGREMAFQLSSRERNELRLMEDALYKMSIGTYGICESCSKKIGLKRLHIMPLTPLCIDCQESTEVS